MTSIDTGMLLFISHTQLCKSKQDSRRKTVGRVRNINTTLCLHICFRINDPTDAQILAGSQVEVGFVWNLPAEKLGRVHLLLSTATKALWWQLGDTCVRSYQTCHNPGWRFKEKLSAFLLLTRPSQWHIRRLCLQRSFSRESSEATEATENKADQKRHKSQGSECEFCTWRWADSCSFFHCLRNKQHCQRGWGFKSFPRHHVITLTLCVTLTPPLKACQESPGAVIKLLTLI